MEAKDLGVVKTEDFFGGILEQRKKNIKVRIMYKFY